MLPEEEPVRSIPAMGKALTRRTTFFPAEIARLPEEEPADGQGYRETLAGEEESEENRSGRVPECRSPKGAGRREESTAAKADRRLFFCNLSKTMI